MNINAAHVAGVIQSETGAKVAVTCENGAVTVTGEGFSITYTGPASFSAFRRWLVEHSLVTA